MTMLIKPEFYKYYLLKRTQVHKGKLNPVAQGTIDSPQVALWLKCDFNKFTPMVPLNPMLYKLSNTKQLDGSVIWAQ